MITQTPATATHSPVSAWSDLPAGALVPRAALPAPTEAVSLVCAALAGALVLAPGWFLSAWYLGWPETVALTAAWIGVGALCGVRALSNIIGPTLSRLRSPDHAEEKQLWRALVRVCGACGEDPERYRLFVVEGRMNAFSTGRDAIGVTADLVNHPTALDGIELEALIAHEVAHHRHCDLALSGPTAWFLIPVWMVERLADAVARIPVLGHRLAEGIRIIVLVVLFPFMFLNAWASRPRELLADRFAVDCGYGIPLEHFLGRLLQFEQRWRGGLVNAFVRTHPPVVHRLARIREAESDAADSYGNVEVSS